MNPTIIWDDQPGGNIEHIEEHGLTPDEVEIVLLDDAIPTAFSASTGRLSASSGTPPPVNISSLSGMN